MNGDSLRMAVFVDYENLARGVQEAEPFSVDLVLARLLEKGSVIVKRAYCEWARFASATRGLHMAGFEMIETPSSTLSGKNSADIRMVVDAIDLCHTKPHLDAFAIVSGDSDFSPLVQKLRENDKAVLGVGVKASTSKLLVEACDEFLFYDDLVRETRRERGVGDPGEAVDLVGDTALALLRDRDGPVWGSHVKQVIKRKRPQFTERYYGFSSFSSLLEATGRAYDIDLTRDDRSGGYVIREA